MRIDYKQAPNQEQYKAVVEGDGACLVLAGAGSGKTRTLVYRVAYLMEKGIAPENILLVTFTNKAAKEMIERVQHLLGFKPDGLNAGTFHSMANKLLRQYAHKIGFTRGFSILDQEDSVSLVKDCMKDFNLNVKGQNFPKANVVQAIISFSRNSNQEIAEVARMKYGYPDFIADTIDKLAINYNDKKKASNSMDFDDLLYFWLLLLQKLPEVRAELAEQFQYILVDEYQDTNYLQAAIIYNLASKHNNVLVVGDDSQSIYSFRAADVGNILNFPKDFPGAKIFKIEHNYRSTPQILNLANKSIEHNQDKFEKKLQAIREGGTMPNLIPARDVYQQAHLICNKIIEYDDKGIDYNNIAILFRSTFHSAELQLELAKRNIPFIVRGGLRYFEQAHVKDLVSYLKILGNFKDELAWKRILKMHDGIGQASAEKIWQEINSYSSLAQIINQGLDLRNSRAQNSWAKIIGLFTFLSAIDFSKKGSMAEAIIYVLEHGYRDYLKTTFDNHKERMDDVQQFIDFVMTYDNLDNLLSDVMLSESFANDSEQREKSIVLTTIHQAKGLEWKYVMILGLRDGDFPHYKSMEDQKQLEEERRLFYVAVTRAKDQLFMLYPIRKNTFQYGEMTGGPSMFIREVGNDKYVTTRSNNFVDEGGEWEDDVVCYD